MPGYHLPFFGALASGLFAEFDLDVEILDPPPGPDMNISHRVAAGGADFSLTGLTYHLLAHRDAEGRMPARFVSVLQPRAGLAAVVPESSDIHLREDLAGRRLARTRASWLADELAMAMADRGLRPPVMVEAPDGPSVALASGAVDMVATFVDAVGIEGRVGFGVRQIHMGADIYGSGLIAADSVADRVVRRVVAAVATAFEAQWRDPDAGVAGFCRRFPHVDPARARASWRELERYAFDHNPTGSMSLAKWRRTIDWLSRVHRLDIDGVADIARPELCLDYEAMESSANLQAGYQRTVRLVG